MELAKRSYLCSRIERAPFDYDARLRILYTEFDSAALLAVMIKNITKYKFFY